MNNVINERDKIELSSFWAYQDFSKHKFLSVNGKNLKLLMNSTQTILLIKMAVTTL